MAEREAMNVNLGHLSDDELIGRVAWLYYVFGLNQGEAAARLGLHRSRVNRLLAEGRDRGLIRVTINHSLVRDFEREQAIARAFKLDFCLATPQTGFVPPDSDPHLAALHSTAARRSVGMVGASFLQGKLEAGALTVGVSWGRTMEQVALHLSTARNPAIRFVSLIGSLTRSSVANPFEVVQAFALRTGGEVHFLPVPFIADSVEDRDVLMSQRMVRHTVELAWSADLYLISVGELAETSVLRQQAIITTDEMNSLREHGVVCDTLGAFFDANGQIVRHPLGELSLSVGAENLRGRNVVLLSAGLEKTAATAALLRSGLVRGLIIDGDSAARLESMF
jgi:DNA-binding transcriptional regulator LsrR (DeoR family)